METEIGRIIALTIFFGWIPIFAIGKVILWCMKAKICNKCTCKKCLKENLGE